MALNFIMVICVFLNRADQHRHAGEDALTQASCRDIAKETLDHVHPRSRRRRKMYGNLRKYFLSLPHFRMLDCGAVVVVQRKHRLQRNRPAAAYSRRIVQRD
jgi:hypothetical protein